MSSFFGVPMELLAGVLAGLLIISMAVLAVMALRNRILFKIAIRNIPRRPAQTVLIIFGLMLSSTIISASLAIGDTVSGTIRGTVLDALGETDIRIRSAFAGVDSPLGGAAAGSAFQDDYLGPAEIDEVLSRVDGDPRVDGVLPQIREPLPVLNERSQLTEARMNVVGLDPARTGPFGVLRTTDGVAVTVPSLGPFEAFINETGAEEIDARAGDPLTVVTTTGRHSFTIREVVEDGGLAANDRRLLVRLDDMQEILGREGQVNRIDLSLVKEGGAAKELSKEVAEDLRVAFTDVAVAEQLYPVLAAPEVVQAIRDHISANSGGIVNKETEQDLNDLIGELESGQGATDRFRALVADGPNAAHVLVALDSAGLSGTLLPVAGLLAQIEIYGIDEIRQDGLDLAELIGSLFTTLFTLFGSFSIIVGMLLIFLVFVLLAASRSSEMGIARAIGTKRRHLVMMFTFEGAAYALGAAIIGTIVGIAASRGLVELLANAVGDGGGDVAIEFRFGLTAASVIAAFSLGMLLTLITVAVSAYRVSRLNIVVAIRDLPQEFVASDVLPLKTRLLHVGQSALGPFYHLYRLVTAVSRQEGRVLPLVMVFVTLLILPWIALGVLAVYRVFAPYARFGWPVLIFGLILAVLGIQVSQASLFTFGASFFLIGIALMVKAYLLRKNWRRETADRVGFTLMGLLVLVFWALPFDSLEWLTGELNGSIEMFVLSGVWMVASAVWVVMYNSQILTGAMEATLGRITFLKPILKPAIAYPAASRFRTGLAVAMFALVIFTMMVFAILNNLGSDIVNTPDRVTGGFDIRTETSRDLAVADMRQAIGDAPNLNSSDFTVIAGHADVPVEARQVGAEERRYLRVDLRGADQEYLKNTRLEVSHYDPAYLPSSIDTEDDAAVARALWDAVARDPSLALISSDRLPAPQGGGGFSFGGPRFEVEGIAADDQAEIKAFTLEVQPSRGRGELTRRTVIGVIDAFAGQVGGGGDPAGLFSGLVTRDDVFGEISDDPVPVTTYRLRIAEGLDPGRVAAAMETAFLDNGLEATDTFEEIEIGIAQNNAFSRLFQSFMGLGLVVGVAALGVLAFRAVVERRHSIGMLRAIGYRARMIQIQFLLESAFVTVLGAALGVGLGALISFNIINQIGDSIDGLTFQIPWATVGTIVVIAVVASLLATLVPAVQASRIKPSEALRYE